MKVGIAGYGVIGARRREHIDAHPALKTVAVCDWKFRNTSGQEVNGAKAYGSYEELLQQDLDILFVCLPNDVAPKVTMLGLEKGLHVFCEKPPGRNVQDIKNVIACEKKHPKLKLKYGFNHRYHSSVQEALNIVRSGELGTLINMRGVYGKSAIIPWPRPSASHLGYEGKMYWRTDREIAGGGILLDQGIHMVDLMRLFAGEFTEVKSFVRNDYWKHDVEDNAYALMRTDSGVIAMIHSTATQWRHTFSLEISLTEGGLILSGILSGTRSYGDERLTILPRVDSDNGNPAERMTKYVQDNSWRDEITEFADAIVNDKPVLTGNSNDALRSVQLVYRIYCADETWKKQFNLSAE